MMHVLFTARLYPTIIPFMVIILHLTLVDYLESAEASESELDKVPTIFDSNLQS